MISFSRYSGPWMPFNICHHVFNFRVAVKMQKNNIGIMIKGLSFFFYFLRVLMCQHRHVMHTCFD